jgi:3-isopropylmalate/(R)-2-methylmalate dehydratase small subunit
MTPWASTFTSIRSRAVLLPHDDIDTDQIIPARFLKVTSRDGLGVHLFQDWRYQEDGSPKEGFPLNAPGAAGSQVLIAGHNFGCGSSREHAPWALCDFGFRAVVAGSFADIFCSNALKNGLLPVALGGEEHARLCAARQADPALEVAVDLERQVVEWAGQPPLGFTVDPFARRCLLDGVDELGYLLSLEREIEAYEARR